MSFFVCKNVNGCDQTPRCTSNCAARAQHTLKRRFFDEQSGALITMGRYYGFGDAGGLAGSFDGYETAEQCLEVVRKDHTNDTSTSPDDLGRVAVCVLTGQQYVDQLKKVEPDYLETGIFGYFVD